MLTQGTSPSHMVKHHNHVSWTSHAASIFVCMKSARVCFHNNSLIAEILQLIKPSPPLNIPQPHTVTATSADCHDVHNKAMDPCSRRPRSSATISVHAHVHFSWNLHDDYARSWFALDAFELTLHVKQKNVKWARKLWEVHTSLSFVTFHKFVDSVEHL